MFGKFFGKYQLTLTDFPDKYYEPFARRLKLAVAIKAAPINTRTAKVLLRIASADKDGG